MNPISAPDILFDDFALLEQHIGRQRLIAMSINANCDCDSSPALSTNYDCASQVSPASDYDSISYPSTLRYDARDPN